MVNFLHISDLHISLRFHRAGNGKSTPQNLLKSIISLANTLNPKPSFIIFSGDLADKGDTESYECLRSIISKSTIPNLLALGNHDNRSNFRNVFYKNPSNDPFFYASEHEGINVIVLDTSQPGKVSGSICDEQFNFLEESLSSIKDVRKILVLHHPPWLDKGGLPWTTLDEKTSCRLGKLLDGKGISGILCGHIHLNQFTNWNNIPLISSSGIQTTIDLFESEDLRLLEAASLNLCKLRAEELSVTCLQVYPTGKERRRINKRSLLSMT